jgi:hypothetical protein
MDGLGVFRIGSAGNRRDLAGNLGVKGVDLFLTTVVDLPDQLEPGGSRTVVSSTSDFDLRPKLCP